MVISGEATWGHDSGVIEANVRDFSGNWTGTGTIVGSGDGERIELNFGQYMEGEVVNTGLYLVELLQNIYDPSGDDVVMKYRHGLSEAACLAAAWAVYADPGFYSLGYAQIRLEAT